MKQYDLKDHAMCWLGYVTNCSKCGYLKGCSAGYESHAIGSPHRDKQTFKLANPNID